MLPFFFIMLGVFARLLPHPANVAPIGAMALFGGVYLSKRLAITLPLVALFVSDIFLGFHATMGYVYGSFVLVSLLGMWVRSKKSPVTLVGASLAGSLLFFLITNFGVWAETNMYPKTWAGLVESYMMALPFFRNSLFGDLFYGMVFFGGYELVKIISASSYLSHLSNLSCLRNLKLKG